MCGIFGYYGQKNAANVLLQGLQRLEYRGYDSSGVAVTDGETIQIVKNAGTLQTLQTALKQARLHGQLGIGHTRWATKGIPTDENAHPHLSYFQTVAVVHNGIVENDASLKRELQKKGYRFVSTTDSETIANLTEMYRTETDSLLKAVQKATKRIRGSYAVAAIDANGAFVVAKNGSPLIVAQNGEESFVSSDFAALGGMCKTAYVMEDGETAEITRGGIRFFNAADEPILKKSVEIGGVQEPVSKDGYESFMRKEMFQIPNAILNTAKYLQGKNSPFLLFPPQAFQKCTEMLFLGCGTAYHAGKMAELFAKNEGIRATAEISSEYLYGNAPTSDQTLAVAVTQSGETAETLQALRKAKERGALTVAVTNVPHSSVCRIADLVLLLKAGAEIGVASTKAYNSQLTALLCLVRFWQSRYVKLPPKDFRPAAEAVRSLLLREEEWKNFAEMLLKYRKILFLGRNIDYVTCLEGALKLKELTYLGCEALCGGELKHGPLAMADAETAVVVLSTLPRLTDKVINSVNEVKTRGAKVFCLSSSEKFRGLATDFYPLPKLAESLSPMAAVVPFQMIAYHAARALGRDTDKPRNLAKSVTVE